MPQQILLLFSQSVVSALVEPDTVIISRSWNDRGLAVQDIKLGSKQEGITLSQGKLYNNHRSYKQINTNHLIYRW